MKSPNRRQAIKTATACAAAVGLAPLSKTLGATEPSIAREFKVSYCLNTSTIRGQNLSLDKEVDIAAKAGYTGIEPWIGKINDFKKNGGNLKDLGKKIADLGLKVESAIGFANWIVDDEERRKKGLESAKRDMDLLKQIGGLRIAAPPAGANNQSGMNLFEIAKRYKALLKVGDETGVVPQVEVWGFSKTLSRLGEVAFVATEAGHPDACILPDVYHIYKGGSDFEGLRMLNMSQVHCFHMNDYPGEPNREEIGDKDRVYTGDGVAPLNRIIKILADGGFQGAFSLELFSPVYWKQEPLEVAKTGLEKMKASVQKALEA